MRKRMEKELYTLYNIEGKREDIEKDHVIASYTYGGAYKTGIAECIKYYDNFVDWINEITSNKFKIGFGLKTLTEDYKHSVEIHRYDLSCSTWVANNKSEEEIGVIMGKIIDFYVNSDPFYYEIVFDNVDIREELTGHQYYKSIYESCDDCKTCDGARCNICQKKYIVENLHYDKVYYEGFNLLKALHILYRKKKNYSNIIADILKYYDIDMDWFNEKIGRATDMEALFGLINEYKIPYKVIEED